MRDDRKDSFARIAHDFIGEDVARLHKRKSIGVIGADMARGTGKTVAVHREPFRPLYHIPHACIDPFKGRIAYARRDPCETRRAFAVPLDTGHGPGDLQSALLRPDARPDARRGECIAQQERQTVHLAFKPLHGQGLAAVCENYRPVHKTDVAIDHTRAIDIIAELEPISSFRGIAAILERRKRLGSRSFHTLPPLHIGRFAANHAGKDDRP